MENNMNQSEATKRCNRCKAWLPVSEFYKSRTFADKLLPTCKACKNVLSSQWKRNNREKSNASAAKLRAAHPERFRAATARNRAKMTPEQRSEMWRRQDLSRKYGMSPAEYDAILAAQNGLCAICGKADQADKAGRKLCVDHSHVTEINRGLLCSACNFALNRIEMDSQWGEKALNYLAKYTIAQMEKTMSKEDIYGKDPDGGAKEAGNEALRVMKGLGITGTEAKSTGKESSRNDLENLKKGDK